MQINNLKRKTPNKVSITVGRGGKRGKTSGRGTKGQNARAGHKKRPEMRERIKKLPKLRGYAFKSIKQYDVFPINLGTLEKNFKNGDIVSPTTLVAKGLVNLTKGQNPRIKILGKEDFSRKIKVVGCTLSAPAKERILKAGGEIK